MASEYQINAIDVDAWGPVGHLAATDGSATHPYHSRLIAPRAASRDLGDAVHAVCVVHGHHPGIVEIAERLATDSSVKEWLAEAAGAFAVERATLARVVAAAGPLPSTPGQALAEAAMIGERHTLERLASSERQGCAAGTVAALLLDWPAIRAVLERAAARFGVEIDTAALPIDARNATAVATMTNSPAAERAAMFGAQQLFAQHRGLWSLLEARASARQ